jgi:MerR family redox-sensitive transcriptional activator SoxR
LALIRGAKRAGFTLGEVRTLVCGFPTETGAAERWQTVATEKLSEVDEAIAQLRIARDLL